MLRLIIILILFQTIGCRNEENIPITEQHSIKKTSINGVSFVAPVNCIEIETLNPVTEINANWICFMPFSFCNKGKPEIYFNNPRQWWGEKDSGIVDCTRMAHQKGLQVMIKPQIWLLNQFTGDISFNTEEDWATFETNYSNFILHFAIIADSAKADLFCIGTELKKFIAARPAYWNHLIDTLNSVFSGELTYAGNWDNYHNIPFYDKLDYIGVNAYFPLSEKKSPTVIGLNTAWIPYVKQLTDFAETHNKKILFTEYGYRSMEFNASEPWNASYEDFKISTKNQVVTYTSLYHTFWQQPWFAGGFLWDWYDYHKRAGGENDSRFTPQNKPVEKIIRKYYGQ